MLISHSHQFLFIHIPKAAGSSIRQALLPYAHDVTGHWMNRLLALFGIHVNHFTHYKSKLFREHSTAAEVRRQLPHQVYESFFKFAFVRNPWDLLVSSYHYLRRNEAHHRHGLVMRLHRFEEYVDYELRRNRVLQKPFVTDDNGELIVDFVGRFESLHEDFAFVAQTLGIPVRLGHFNKSEHSDYRSYYNDRLIELVVEHFRDDIEMFGYAFDDGRRRAAA
jgi:hypothetical protein